MQGIQNLYVKGDSGSYYISASEDRLQADAWMVCYVDVTEEMRFFYAISGALLLILVMGIGISWGCTYRMTKRLTLMMEDLSRYADQIGGENYQTTPPVLPVQELDFLALAMKKMAEKLDGMQRQQKTFFQNVSHEFRTPLTSIRCYGEGIRYGVMEPESSSEIILAETEKLSTMVEEVLYLSRLESRTPEEHRTSADLRELLSSCALSQKKPAEEKGLSLEYQFDEEPVWLQCREEDIKRLCDNLISNAIRYARSRIVLECRNAEQGGQIVVADDGDGISKEDMPHLFERFYKGKGGQHGIGLSIVASVAQRYGAKIRVTNDGGARFEILFLKEF